MCEISNESKRVNNSSVFGRCMNLILKAVKCSAQECDRCYFGNVVTVVANKATNYDYVDVFQTISGSQVSTGWIVKAPWAIFNFMGLVIFTFLRP